MIVNVDLARPSSRFRTCSARSPLGHEWIEVKVLLDKFEALSFWRVVKDASAVNPDEVNALGLVLSDKKAGLFKMEVQWTKVERVGKKC